MRELSKRGWTNRCDTFDSYYKKINDYQICVTKHITDKEWECVLIGLDHDEVTINRNATLDWVLKVVEALEL